MRDDSGRLSKFLEEQGIRFLGVAQDGVPTTESVWRYIARYAVEVTERVAGDDILALERAFERLAGRLSLFESVPTLLSIEGFVGPWAMIDVPECESLVRRLCVRPDEPSFVLACPKHQTLLAVDTEEWEYWLIAARWSDDGILVPIAGSDSSVTRSPRGR